MLNAKTEKMIASVALVEPATCAVFGLDDVMDVMELLDGASFVMRVTNQLKSNLECGFQAAFAS